jgi:hypothetical protein
MLSRTHTGCAADPAAVRNHKWLAWLAWICPDDTEVLDPVAGVLDTSLGRLRMLNGREAARAASEREAKAG